MSYLEVRDLCFRYPGSDVEQLSEFCLSVEQGECVALVGASGCAKTTVLRLIAGLEQAKSGVIELAGTVLAGPRVFIEPEQRGIGMVFQDYALFPHLSVARNVGYGVARRERERAAAAALELVGMSAHAKKYPHQLSGGQQQRVALARALAPRPGLLLLDEPFSNLDADLRESVRADVREILTSAGITSLLVTHDADDAAALAQRVIRM